jgi:hypothetical protein
MMTAGAGSAMRKRVIFHVGLPKTGTSAFQDALELNRATLAGHGIAFSRKADLGGAFRKAMRDIVRHGPGRLRQFRLDRAARDMRLWADGQEGQVILITDENLLGWRIRDMYRMRFADGPAHALAALRKAFESYDLSWVLFRREPASHMRSGYRYAVKLRGISNSFDDWKAQAGSADALDRLVTETAEALGPDGHVFDMETEKESDRPWGAPILDLAGVPADVIDALAPAPRTNEGMPDDLLDYVRKINAIGLDKKQRLQVVDVLLGMHADLTGAKPRSAYGRVK